MVHLCSWLFMVCSSLELIIIHDDLRIMILHLKLLPLFSVQIYYFLFLTAELQALLASKHGIFSNVMHYLLTIYLKRSLKLWVFLLSKYI